MFKKLIILLVFFCIYFPKKAGAYSVLTHEAIIDASWKISIEPLLLKKYPNSTADQLLEAHSYAYGGSIMPDIGYYPFGSKLFTNLLHNVRSGDFTAAIIEEASDLNEYAFALGILAHYMADNYGHSLATNIAVPLIYPKIKSRFGDCVTYADHKKSHSRMEFGFDLLQTCRGNYATTAYHDFIGFRVSKRVIERAFFKTYGIDVNKIFGNIYVAIGSLRWSVKALLPTIVKAAWINKRAEIKKVNAGATGHTFSYKMKNRIYYHEFGRDHEKAGLIPRIVSLVIPVLPKIGPLSKLKFKKLNAESENLFIKSFDSTLTNYAAALNKLYSQNIMLPNKTLDTGKETKAGEYAIANSYYDIFLLLLKEGQFHDLTPVLKMHLVNFYKQIQKPSSGKHKDLKNYRRISEALVLLNNHQFPEVYSEAKKGLTVSPDFK